LKEIERERENLRCIKNGEASYETVKNTFYQSGGNLFDAGPLDDN
jgi:hypothetical protein